MKNIVTTANQVFMMELVFKFAYEDREKEDTVEKEHMFKYKLRYSSINNALVENIELTAVFMRLMIIFTHNYLPKLIRTTSIFSINLFRIGDTL